MWQKFYQTVQPHALWIMILFHLVGLLGIVFIDVDFFAGLSALNLLLSCILLFIDDEGPQKEFWQLFLLCFGLGYIVELIGITTGFPFGQYQYGENLGPLLFDVPLIIGLNWFLITMGAGFVSQELFSSRWARIVAAASLMVFVDFWIEPVADDLSFWRWGTEWDYPDYVPLYNYMGWFVVSVTMQYFFQRFMRLHINNLAIRYFFIVLTFFILLNIMI